MTWIVREHPEARAELRAVAHWYEGKRAGLGNEVYDLVDAAIADIVAQPTWWSRYSFWDGEPVILQRHIKKYPYLVLYYVDDPEIVIIAYASDRQLPGYWQHRLDP